MLNYFIDNAIHVPVSTQKELVLYRSDRIADVEFGGATNLFDPFGVTPVQ